MSSIVNNKKEFLSCESNNLHYANHWDAVYKNNSSDPIEWHISYEQAKNAIDPYIKALIESSLKTCKHLLIVDVGCGKSNFGVNILNDYNFSTLLLTDFSNEIIKELNSLHKEDNRIKVKRADCRAMAFVQTNSAFVVLDKGTFDALIGENDKFEMLKECKRMLNPSGFFISISFPSVQRINFFDKYCPRLGLTYRLKVIGKGDPKDGHHVVFVFILSIKYENAVINDSVDELTKLCLNRIKTTGSLYLDEPEADAKAEGKLMQKLFDDSSEEESDDEQSFA
jgi:ubiquinone/menaquinone biosynthesis C-methylase UbiE